MARKLKSKGITINVLNPGIVDTGIRRNGQFPKFIKFISPLIRLLIKSKLKSPEEYAKIPVSILIGNNQEADNFTLINKKGKGIKGSFSVNNKRTQQELYNFTIQEINSILKVKKVENWL